MLKTYKKLTVAIVLALMIAALTIPVAAMDFQVLPELPDNQRHNDSTFFDLLVTPGQRQNLVIEIRNISDNDIVVLVETITASTGRNGQINYTSRGELDETLRFSFEDLVTLPQDHFEVPALSSIEVAIDLEVPNEWFDGAILGSIRVLREATQEERDEGGMIVNQFASVTAVRLVTREDAEEIPVDLALGEITAELINYRASIVVPIRNLQPRIIQGARATARIFPLGANQPIFEYNLERLDFAPNSVFPFSFVDREGYGIEAGDYTAVIEVEHEGEVWSFNQDFHITAQAAATVNESAVNQHGAVRPQQGLTMWMWIAIIGGGLLLIVIIILIIVLARRKSEFPRH